jgi:hypothetical protein
LNVILSDICAAAPKRAFPTGKIDVHVHVVYI